MTLSHSGQNGLSREPENDELKIINYLINRVSCSKKYYTEIGTEGLKLATFYCVPILPGIRKTRIVSRMSIFSIRDSHLLIFLILRNNVFLSFREFRGIP